MVKIFIIIFLLTSLDSVANIRVAPQVQEINLNRPTTKKIYLQNEGDKLKKIKIYSKKPENQEKEDYYLGNWIVVYPKIVYLKPNSKKIIRMGVRPPKGLKDGEYRGHLVFEQQPLERRGEETAEGSVGVNVEIIHTLISTVYGYSGDLEYKAVFDEFKVVTDKSKTYLLSQISNTGTTALNLVYKITYYKGQRELDKEEILLGKVMRENKVKPVSELNKIPENADEMRIEKFYRLERDGREVREGELEYEEFSLGEDVIPIKTMTKEEYFRKYEPERLKEKQEVEAETENEEELKGR